MNTATVAPSTQPYNLIDLQASHPFWLRVREMPSGCWEWQGAIYHGVPTYCDNYQSLTARKVAHEQTIGPVPHSKSWKPSCSNRLCMNPEHIRMPTVAETFWRKVDKNGPVPQHHPELGPCWLWLGKLNDAGYGRFRVDGVVVRAHQFAKILSGSSKPDGMGGCHHCDNPGCVRPEHVFWGTQLDNMRDCTSKHRLQYGDDHWVRRLPAKVARGDRHWAKVHPEKTARGEAAGQAKLTESDVLQIRAMCAAGANRKHVADLFHISPSNVQHILNRSTWKHVA